MKLFMMLLLLTLCTCDRSKEKHDARQDSQRKPDTGSPGQSILKTTPVLESAVKETAELPAGQTEVDELLHTEGVASEDDRVRALVVHPIDSAPMVLVPGGPFIYGIDAGTLDSVLRNMGQSKLPIFRPEYPLDKNRLVSNFYIDVYEVTNRQYRRFVAATNHRRPAFWDYPSLNDPDQPVVGVGWEDALAYATWARKRLPTEEEWEKAARGTDGRLWPWGNSDAESLYCGNTSGHLVPVRVGSYSAGASPYGVMDLAGNVYEMTTGKWWKSGPTMRGGSFLNAGPYVMTTFRWSPKNDSTGASWLGFRCAADPESLKVILLQAHGARENEPIRLKE